MLLSFRAQINALSPINRLPNEILSRIFHFVSLEPIPDETFAPEELLGWIRVTHVCGRWRQVACSDSMLWQRIFVHIGKRWTAEMIQRSGCASLFYEAYISWTEPPPDLPVLHLILEERQLIRTQELSLTLSTGSMEYVMPFLTAPAPRLRVLDLTVNHAVDDAHLPLQLLRGHSSMLRILRLQALNFQDWGTLSFSALEELQIHCFSDNADPRPTNAQLACILGRLPQLKILTLEGCLPPLEHHMNAALTIQLPHLTRIGIRGHILECQSFLDSVQFPSSCDLHIDCKAPLVTLDLVPITSYIRTFLQREPHMHPIQYIDIDIPCLRG
jgi:hypothetical protein